MLHLCRVFHMTMPNAPTSWQLLVISLPSNRATPRMRVWRALKALGAAVLRDGVYLLPGSPSAHAAFTQQALEVQRSGGTAQVLRVDAPEAEQERQFRALFDRAGDYARIMQNARKLKSGLSPRRRARPSVGRPAGERLADSVLHRSQGAHHLAQGSESLPAQRARVRFRWRHVHPCGRARDIREFTGEFLPGRRQGAA